MASPAPTTEVLSAPKPQAKHTARRGNHSEFVARIAREASRNDGHSSSASQNEDPPLPRARYTARRGNHAGFVAHSAKSVECSNSPNAETRRAHPRAKQMARRGDHAGFLARIARKQKEDGEYWHPLQESSEEELSEEEKSSSSSSSSESEEEDHPALPRTRQTARRGDHVGFLARMARKSENMSEHSMPSIDEDGDRPGPWPKQTARRGDHAGFLARMASRNRQSSDRANSPKQEEENHRHPRAKQTARRGGLRARLSTRPVPSRVTKSIKQTEWDITGDWDIECEELANYIHGAPKRLSMEVYHDTYRPGFHMATFNFNIIVGIMRITCPTPKNTDQKLKGTYAYRGRETGEGEIQLLSDEASYRIVFKDRGSTMEGKFSGTGVGRVKFTGSKVSKGSHRRAASECEWECYSPDAWERARKGRWGRWAGW